jgi:ATP-dependent protease ClpP protease subunit
MKLRMLWSLVVFTLGCASVRQSACTTPITLPLPLPLPHRYTMVQIDDYITEDSAKVWQNQILQAAHDHEYVTIEFNTNGGLNDPGFKLAKTIEEVGKPTICIVDGRAQSYGFYLLQSCTIRAMTTRSFLMMHETHYDNLLLSHPNRHELQRYVDDLTAEDNAMSEHYAKRMGVDVKQLRSLMADHDVHFGWEAALHWQAVGFCR